MTKNARTLVALTAAGAVLALPATVAAQRPADPGQQGRENRCQNVRTVGYQVTGTLVSATASSVTMTVRSANSHARKSGEIADQNTSRRGVQVRGATVTVPVTAATLRLRGYEGTDTPSAGDRVKVSGRVPLQKRNCTPAGTSLADRYGEPQVRRVTISDRDADS